MSNKQLQEVNAATASKKFFDMIEDTVDDFQSSGSIDDTEKARLIATVLNGQAKKYLTDSKTLWPLVCEKLVEFNGDYKGEPVQTTPTDLEVPTTPFGASSSAARPFWTEGENVRTSFRPKLSEATGVEFYTDNDGKIRARVGSSDMTLQDFGNKAKDPRNTDIQALVKGMLKKANAEEDIDGVGDLIGILSQEKNPEPDIAVRGEGTSAATYSFDTEELDAELDRREASAEIDSVLSSFNVKEGDSTTRKVIAKALGIQL